MKKTYVALGVILFASISGYALVRYTQNKNAENACPTDVMMCPNGSSISRSGAMCEFSTCPQEVPAYMKNGVGVVSITEPISVSAPTASSSDSLREPRAQVTQSRPTTIFSKIAQSISGVVSQSTGFIQSAISSGIKDTTPTATINNQVNNTTPSPAGTSSIDETRYDVVNGNIVDQDNSIIYTLPPSNDNASTSSSTPEWETHIVNVVPVNEVAPVVGGIPVTGLPGKYYLSENSFGSIENCEFSNKIYILDTKTNDRTLIYEENSASLANDDARACNSEIYLLATDEEKLILKYHTINTNMICESSWSEPEKTWYLDVTNITSRTKRYIISNTLYTQAENEELTCRANLDSAQ